MTLGPSLSTAREYAVDKADMAWAAAQDALRRGHTRSIDLWLDMLFDYLAGTLKRYV